MQRFMHLRRRTYVLLALALAIPAAALAVWIITADGTGDGKVGSLEAPTIVASGAAKADLFPSSSATGTLSMSVENSGEMPLELTGIEKDPGEANAFSVSGGSTVCSPGDFTLPTQTGLSVEIPPETTTVVHVPNAVRLAETAKSSCQGQTYTVKVRGTFAAQ